MTLPVVETVAETFSRVFKNLPKVFSIGLIPIIVYFGISLVGSILAVLAGSVIVRVLFDFIAYFTMGLFALVWLRFILEGNEKFQFSFGPREQKFFGYYALLMAPVLLILIIGAALLNIGFVALIIVFFLVLMLTGAYTAVQLVFPAAATGEPTSFEKAWQQAMPSFGPMLGINMILVLAIAIPLLIVLYILGLITIQLAINAGTGGLIVAVLLIHLIYTPLIFIALALMVTALALVYRRVKSGGSAAAMAS